MSLHQELKFFLLQCSADLDQQDPSSWLKDNVSLSLDLSCMLQYVRAVCYNGELAGSAHAALALVLM